MKAQGEMVRIMKRDGAAPADVASETQTLRALKLELKSAAAESTQVRRVPRHLVAAPKWKVDKGELDDVLLQRRFVVPALEVRR